MNIEQRILTCRAGVVAGLPATPAVKTRKTKAGSMRVKLILFLSTVLFCFSFLLDAKADPVMSITYSSAVGDYDINPENGLEKKHEYLVANLSPENIQDNNLIIIVLPAGSNQGVVFAEENRGLWTVNIGDDQTTFIGYYTGQYIGVGGDNTFFLYTASDQPMGTGLATAVAAGSAYGTLDFNAVEVPVPLCLPVCFVPPVDLTNAIKTVAGAEHFLALTSIGTVVAWGDTRDGQCDVPAGLSNVVDIAAGRTHSAALLADGSVVCWGSETNVPSTVFGAKAIAARENHTIAMMRGTDPTLPDTDFDGANDGVEVSVGTDPLDPNQRAMQLTAYASANGAVSPTNQWVFPGSQLTVTASPETYWKLGEWTGGTHSIVSNGWNSVTVLMTNDVSLTAVFVQIVTENLNVPHQWLADQGFDLEHIDPEVIAATDHDHDGYTTGQEYILGTSPTNAASALTVALTPPALDFEMVTGRLYSVEYCDNLVSNDWKSLTNNIPGSGNLIEIIDDDSSPRRFYRINIRMAE